MLSYHRDIDVSPGIEVMKRDRNSPTGTSCSRCSSQSFIRPVHQVKSANINFACPTDTSRFSIFDEEPLCYFDAPACNTNSPKCTPQSRTAKVSGMMSPRPANPLLCTHGWLLIRLQGLCASADLPQQQQRCSDMKFQGCSSGGKVWFSWSFLVSRLNGFRQIRHYQQYKGAEGQAGVDVQRAMSWL
ncbi:hypothetical protein LIA77_05629 [Sarocladium implicatum]|nr:hypothetical protein LIA77_05629 [Sarocladium implicatum]